MTKDMKTKLFLVGAIALFCMSAAAQVGHPYIHDPSTIQECDGKYTPSAPVAAA